MKTTTIVYDGASLRMPVAHGGDVRLYSDGTFEFVGNRQISAADVIEVFSALDPPSGGRVWWKMFAANQVFRSAPEYFPLVVRCLGFNSNQVSNSKNNVLIDWIRESQIYKLLSVSVFIDCRTQFRNARPHDSPRNDFVSEISIAYCRKNPNPSRDNLKLAPWLKLSDLG